MSKKIEGLISTLNYSCFVHAGECLTKLCQMVEEESGVKPSLNDLCEILVVSLQCCSADLLSDANVQAVDKLTPKVAPHKKIILKPGDVLAIPREKGGNYFVIYIASNRFGEALAFSTGTSKFPMFPQGGSPSRPNSLFILGKPWWSVAVGGELTIVKTCLICFPSHQKSITASRIIRRMAALGRMEAEAATGELRELTEAEANLIGLTRSTYRQVMLEEQFEKYLQDNLG